MMRNNFFQLLEVALDIRKQFTHSLSSEEWGEIMDMAHKQALVGILFEGINKLPKKSNGHRNHLSSNGRWQLRISSAEIC